MSLVIQVAHVVQGILVMSAFVVVELLLDELVFPAWLRHKQKRKHKDD